MNIIPLKYDYIFTGIFNNPDNIELTKELISLLFEIDKDKLVNLKILSREELREFSSKDNGKRPKQRDLVVDVDGIKYNVEVDSSYSKGVMNKNTHYISYLYARQEKMKGGNYVSIPPVNQMNIQDRMMREE